LGAPLKLILTDILPSIPTQQLQKTGEGYSSAEGDGGWTGMLNQKRAPVKLSGGFAFVENPFRHPGVTFAIRKHYLRAKSTRKGHF